MALDTTGAVVAAGRQQDAFRQLVHKKTVESPAIGGTSGREPGSAGGPAPTKARVKFHSRVWNHVTAGARPVMFERLFDSRLGADVPWLVGLSRGHVTMSARLLLSTDWDCPSSPSRTCMSRSVSPISTPGSSPRSSPPSPTCGNGGRHRSPRHLVRSIAPRCSWRWRRTSAASSRTCSPWAPTPRCSPPTTRAYDDLFRFKIDFVRRRALPLLKGGAPVAATADDHAYVDASRGRRHRCRRPRAAGGARRLRAARPRRGGARRRATRRRRPP